MSWIYVQELLDNYKGLMVYTESANNKSKTKRQL